MARAVGYDHEDPSACPTAAAIGWESLPSKRRLYEAERLSHLYRSPDCFADANAAQGRFPGVWRRVSPPEDGCWRCGDWRSTLEDTFARHRRSDRLDVVAFQASIPSAGPAPCRMTRVARPRSGAGRSASSSSGGTSRTPSFLTSRGTAAAAATR